MGQAIEADIPGANVADLLRLVTLWKVPVEKVLAGTGLTEAALREPGSRVSLDVCADIVERAQALTGEPALPLHMGMQMRLSSHGFLGFAAGASATLREALALAERFAATRTSALGITSHIHGRVVSVVFEERVPLGRLREFAVLTLMVGIWQIAQALTGKQLIGLAECAFPAPGYLPRLGASTSEMIRFDQPAHRLVFDVSILDVPLRSPDPVALALAREQCERELRALVDSGFVARVRGAIDGPDGLRALPEVARSLHVSTRTLKRKLAGHGTTFTALVDDLRRQRALLLIDDASLSLAEVATKLGYSEPPNFTRAFRRWTGASPAEYRARRTRGRARRG
jgi:AraC-like DNA-binding protein